MLANQHDGQMGADLLAAHAADDARARAFGQCLAVDQVMGVFGKCVHQKAASIAGRLRSISSRTRMMAKITTIGDRSSPETRGTNRRTWAKTGSVTRVSRSSMAATKRLWVLT